MPIGERQPKPEKVESVAEIKEMLQKSTVILTDYQGLDMKSLDSLRRKLRETGGGYKVVKNTLFTRASKDTAAAPLSDGLAGPTAMVFTDDPVGAAKTLQEFMKGAKVVKVKVGVVDGQVVSDKQIESLAKIPPKEQLYAMVVGGLQSPITGLVGTLQQLMSQLVFTLQGVADKKQAA
ncbi:MAG: 50S ribosomal protein L10 [Armatimonadota bacterium]|nr:50S ribosomal protein L10 [bacterium]